MQLKKYVQLGQEDLQEKGDHQYIQTCVCARRRVCKYNKPTILMTSGNHKVLSCQKNLLEMELRLILEAQFCGSSSENELNSLTWQIIIQHPPDALGHILTKKKRRRRSTGFLRPKVVIF